MDFLADFHVARLTLLVLAATAVAIYAWQLGASWVQRTWPSRTATLGVLGVLGYVALGQIKASAYGLPVDGLTAFGGVALSVLVIALMWLRSSRHEEA